MRKNLPAVGLLLVLGLTGCVSQAGSPSANDAGTHPTPAPTTPTATSRPGSIAIGAQRLTVTEQSGSKHEYSYDLWPADLVSVASSMLNDAPGSSTSDGDNHTPPTTTYLWPGLFLTHSEWAAGKSGVTRLTVYAQGEATAGTDISTSKGVRVGDAAASVAGYPVFCNVDKKCFENQSTTSGASTTLRVLDSSGTGADAGLVIGYVNPTDGVTDIITADYSWGTLYGIDVRD